MTIGIYSIRNLQNNKRYIGKSVNIEKRLWAHKWNLTRPEMDKKKCNRHLYSAVQKHGWSSFETEVLEHFDHIDEELIASRELHWMDHFNTCNRKFGYNLRRDSSTKMIVHEETAALLSIAHSGERNGNFGNRWSEEQKANMSLERRLAHSLGTMNYNDDWRRKISIASTEMWKDEDKKRSMADKVSKSKMKYDYQQYDRTGTVLIRTWDSVKEIVSENPEWKWQNIYNVCHGHKPSYRGFVWRQVPKQPNYDELLGGVTA